MENKEKNLTRIDLYKLVWEKPMMHIAEIYGFSDRGLSKICEKYKIPVPPRGYWAKLQAGYKIKKPKLEKFPGNNNSEIILKYKETANTNKTTISNLSEIIKTEKENIKNIHFDEKEQKYHPLIIEWNTIDRKDRYYKFDKRERKALSLLLFELEKRGYTVEQGSERRSAKVYINKEDYVQVRALNHYEIMYKRKVRPSDGWKWEWRNSDDDVITVLEPTEYLKFYVSGKLSYSTNDYREDEKTTLETALVKAIIYVHKKTEMQKQERLEKERQEKLKTFKKQQKIKYDQYIKENENELQKFIAFEKYKRNKLFEDSKFWNDLKQIKEFVESIKEQNDPNNEDWLNWADSFINDINPANNSSFSNYDKFEYIKPKEETSTQINYDFDD